MKQNERMLFSSRVMYSFIAKISPIKEQIRKQRHLLIGQSLFLLSIKLQQQAIMIDRKILKASQGQIIIIKNYRKNSKIIVFTQKILLLYKIQGSPYSPTIRCNPWAFQVKLKIFWKQIEERSDKVLTHGALLSHGSYDHNYPPTKRECGDLALANKIKEIKPLYHIFGHVHEGYGMTEENIIQYLSCENLLLKQQYSNFHSNFNSNISLSTIFDALSLGLSTLGVLKIIPLYNIQLEYCSIIFSICSIIFCIIQQFYIQWTQYKQSSCYQLKKLFKLSKKNINISLLSSSHIDRSQSIFSTIFKTSKYAFSVLVKKFKINRKCYEEILKFKRNPKILTYIAKHKFNYFFASIDAIFIVVFQGLFFLHNRITFIIF
ncbi:unnamed protein product [Paramecium sonneborni]|uniref:Calcineurin-like phosphoesterase domain-containing protein n=1 Tax=Paramecium sonneborni TaxID=65129 RepID=A0A8S1RR41_9CILI|nr:unnamed protein product [Paramecium sonneborni]